MSGVSHAPRSSLMPDGGTLCEDCLFVSSDRTNLDFPCKKWGTVHPPFPNLLRYSNDGADVNLDKMIDADFVEICTAYKKGA